MRSLIRKILRENDEFDWIKDEKFDFNPFEFGKKLFDLPVETTIPIKTLHGGTNTIYKLLLKDGRIWDIELSSSEAITSAIADDEEMWVKNFGGDFVSEMDPKVLEVIKTNFPFVESGQVFK